MPCSRARAMIRAMTAASPEITVWRGVFIAATVTGSSAISAVTSAAESATPAMAPRGSARPAMIRSRAAAMIDGRRFIQGAAPNRAP